MSAVDDLILQVQNQKVSDNAQPIEARVDTFVAAMQQLEGTGGSATPGGIFYGSPTGGFAQSPIFNFDGNSLTFGQSATSTQFVIEALRNLNASTWFKLVNPNGGNQATAGLYLGTDTNFTSRAEIMHLSPAYTAAGVFKPDSTMFISNGANGINIVSQLANAPIVFGTVGVEVGRFDFNGNLGIGRIPTNGTQFMLDVERDLNQSQWIRITNGNAGNAAGAGYVAAANIGNFGQFFHLSSVYAGGGIYRPDSTMFTGTGAQGVTVGPTVGGAPLVFCTNGVEQARFLPTGNLVLQGTAVVAAYPSDLTCQFNGASLSGIVTNDTNAAAGVDNAMVFVRNGSSVGSIQTTLTSTAYQPSSDKNLKTEVTELLDTGSLIDAVSPHIFTWNLTGERDYGFFAQELHAVISDTIPNAVGVGSPDEDFGNEDYKIWGVDQSKLVAILWNEIQALRKRVAVLEGATP